MNYKSIMQKYCIDKVDPFDTSEVVVKTVNNIPIYRIKNRRFEFYIKEKGNIKSVFKKLKDAEAYANAGLDINKAMAMTNRGIRREQVVDLTKKMR